MVLKPQSLSPSDTLPPGKTTPSKPCQMCQHLGWVIGGAVFKCKRLLETVSFKSLYFHVCCYLIAWRPWGNSCLDRWASVSTLYNVLTVMNVSEHILIGEGCLVVQHGKVTWSLCLEARKIL